MATPKAKTKHKTDEVSEEIKEAVVKSIHHDEKEAIKDLSVEQKLVALFSLQLIDSQIDRIRIVRGELPLEVQDLEDEVAGLTTRIENLSVEIEQLAVSVEEKKAAIKDCQAMIKKYETQQKNVRNNREYDSLNKEIEFQGLEIQLCEKRINEYKSGIEQKTLALQKAKEDLEERSGDLEQKKNELNDIVNETEKEESQFYEQSQANQRMIDDRLLLAYQRIRNNARNGLAVVKVERDACGGCFSKIPPQRQLDIRMHKKIIVCEYCGRILVDEMIEEKANNKTH